LPLWRATKHENGVQRASHVEMGQSVIQASVVGDCLKVPSLCDDKIPPIRLTRAGKGITFCRTRNTFSRQLRSAA
jgi:hypothetical protein